MCAATLDFKKIRMPVKVTIISGPTASGKSDAALFIARTSEAEIISCDSVQVYRHMDIGSAKPSAAELAQVPHSLIDVCEPSKQFNVQAYIDIAKAALENALRRGRPVIVAGGSGFYLKAWFAAVTDELEIPACVKEFAERAELAGGAESLANELLKVDSRAGSFVDLKNPRRTRKALERCMASGKSVEELLTSFKTLPCPMGDIERDVQIIDRPDEELKERIRARTRTMLARGLIGEVRSLLKMGIKENPSAAGAVGYRETIAWLEGGLRDEEALARDIEASTWSLVKKQRKFFKNNLY